jgi:hypothetical protein
VAIFAAYLTALIYARNSVPDGINNDVAEEALRGLYLVLGHHFEVVTFAVGNSAETFYLYLVGAAAALIGTSTLAIQLVSWIFGLACIWLTAKVASRVIDGMPEWIPLLVAASSLWLFHYARSGLRAICSPFFLALFALLLDRAERQAGNARAALLCGAVLGLSIYGYTSDRALAIAFAGYAIYRLIRESQPRGPLLRRYGLIAAGALIASIPNLVFFMQRPSDFLSRGNYVLRGSLAERMSNVVWSVLFPFHLADPYREFAAAGFQSDGVSAGFAGAGFNPVPLIFAAAFAYGLWRARGILAGYVPSFLIAAWAVVIVSVGLAGPSLTRLLILFPFYTAFAAAGFAFVIRDWPWSRIPAALLILAVGIASGFAYFSSGVVSQYYAGPATAVGEEASQIAQSGSRVVCVVSGEAGVVRYLTYRDQPRVKIVEFYNRPPNPAEIPFDELRGGVLLLERTPQFADFATRFPATWVTHEPRYDRITLPAN